MDGLELYLKLLHDCLEYVGEFASLIALAFFLYILAVVHDKNQDSSKGE
ncbi:hypothetical protein [Bacillus sp. BB56-3]|nr:hypothetical protein [Bacillus sp. BB56-3]